MGHMASNRNMFGNYPHIGTSMCKKAVVPFLGYHLCG